VTGDRARLEQVFANLLSNALKFAPSGSVVEVELSGANEGSQVLVSDRGPGIPEAELENIFDRHVQVGASSVRRGLGSGLGLYITRQLVLAHGGAIRAENRDGGGSRLRVDLPEAGPVSSEGELCALLVGSGDESGAWLRQVLARRGVSCTAAERDDVVATATRLRPHLVLARQASEDPALLEALEAVSRRLGAECLVVCIESAESGIASAVADVCLVEPVSETEIFETLREALVRQVRTTEDDAHA
jgi:hypothetical protein